MNRAREIASIHFDNDFVMAMFGEADFLGVRLGKSIYPGNIDMMQYLSNLANMLLLKVPLPRDDEEEQKQYDNAYSKFLNVESLSRLNYMTVPIKRTYYPCCVQGCKYFTTEEYNAESEYYCVKHFKEFVG